MKMKKETLLSLISLIIAFIALIFNIESRIRDRARVQLHFDDNLYGVFGDTSHSNFVPETLESIFYVINSGKRGISVLKTKCFVINNNQHYGLLNASETIYDTIEFPIDLSSDSS